MPQPTPDPSASLTPFQQYAVEVVGQTLDKVQWGMTVGFIAVSLMLTLLAIIALSVAFRR